MTPLVNARTAGVCERQGGEVVPCLYPASFSVGGIIVPSGSKGRKRGEWHLFLRCVPKGRHRGAWGGTG